MSCSSKVLASDWPNLIHLLICLPLRRGQSIKFQDAANTDIKNAIRPVSNLSYADNYVLISDQDTAILLLRQEQ